MNKKGEIQEEVISLSRKHDNLLLSFATGVGKTLCALKAMNDFLHPDGQNIKAYIILKESNHELVWRDEIAKWGLSHLLNYITFFCYASLKNYINTTVNFIILDEVHALSEVRDEYLNTIKCEKLISLSATVQSHVKQRLKAYKPGFYEWHISLQKAIAEGFLPEPDMFILRISLDNKEKKLIYQKSKLSPPITVTAKEYYGKLNRSINFWEQQYYTNGGVWRESKWLQKARERKVFIANYKTTTLKKLLKYLEKDRLICFTGSIEQCNDLGAEYAVHSKIDEKDRKRIIQDFNERESDKLFAVGMLREGMNLEALDSGIIGQLDNQQGSGSQMIGRTLRSISPKVYFVIVKDTQDEVYLEKVLKGIDKKYIHEFTLPEPEELVTL